MHRCRSHSAKEGQVMQNIIAAALVGKGTERTIIAG